MLTGGGVCVLPTQPRLWYRISWYRSRQQRLSEERYEAVGDEHVDQQDGFACSAHLVFQFDAVDLYAVHASSSAGRDRGPHTRCVSKTVTAVTLPVTFGADGRAPRWIPNHRRAMSDGVDEAVLRRGRDAAARGDWQEAFDLLMQADADGLMSPADLPVLGEVAYAAGHLDVTIEAWERAHAASLQCRRPGRGRRRGGSRGDAPASRYRPDGAGARLVGQSRATPRGSG